MADTAWLAERIDPGTVPLAVGDVLAILLVVAVGMFRHHGVSGTVGDPAGVVLTALPFLVGWAIAAPLVGAYAPGAGESAKASVPLAVRSWVLADLVGIGLRATPFVAGGGGVVSLAIFFLVMLVVGGVALAGWRTLAFAVR